MPFDTKHTSPNRSLSEQLLIAASAICDASSSDALESQDPRIVTRGSFSRKALKQHTKTGKAPSSSPDLTDLLDRFFFDWFQVTLSNSEGKATCDVGGPEEAKAIDAAFKWCAAQGLHPGAISGGHNGYRAALPWSVDAVSKEVVCRINAGSSSGIMPNVMLTGGHGACAVLAPQLQEAFPTSRLSRADVACDWSQEGLWDDLFSMAKILSKSNSKLGGVRVIESDKGRTFYLGSNTSTVSLRVYEKDRERAAKGVIDPADVDPDLIRIEWTFRPQSRSKAGMAGKTPSEMIRTSVWARDFMARAAKVMRVTDRVEKINREEVEREVVEKTLQGAVQHAIDQYGKSFSRLAAALIVERDHGGHYDTAVVTVDEIETEAVAIFKHFLERSGAAEAVIIDERLDVAMDPDAWRDSYSKELLSTPGIMKIEASKHQRRVGSIARRHGYRLDGIEEEVSR